MCGERSAPAAAYFRIAFSREAVSVHVMFGQYPSRFVCLDLATGSAPIPLLSVRPIAIFGQDAKMEGRSEQVPESANQRGREIVGVNYVEQLFRYCADQRFRDDTGFFILEQDFRFYAADVQAFERLHAKKLGGMWAQAGLFKPTADLNTALKTGEPTPELRDLLACVTAARRWATAACPHGHHNLIWFSWEPNLQGSPTGHYRWGAYPAEQRDFVPGTGNYMWWLTARGARHIKNTVLAAPPCLQSYPTSPPAC